ncbi:MAG: hypothetical protein HQ475_14200 [SAR202 cluster bacterium]|nr:hypothetical protein [SAR202 cluster bacterium]
MNKRVLFPIFLGLIVVTLVACLGGDGASDETTEPSAAVTTPTQVLATDVPSSTPVATAGELFLQLVAPAETEIFTAVSPMTVTGRTRVDAVVTINDAIVEPDIDGMFTLDVPLEEGPNIIEVVASVASNEQMDLVLVAIYEP